MKQTKIPHIDISLTDRIELSCSISWYKFFEVVSVRVNFQDLGWTAGTGTPNRGAFAAYGGQVINVGYTQAQVQAIDDALQATSKRVLALELALRAARIIE